MHDSLIFPKIKHTFFSGNLEKAASPVDTGRKLNVYKTFNLPPESTGSVTWNIFDDQVHQRVKASPYISPQQVKYLFCQTLCQTLWKHYV